MSEMPMPNGWDELTVRQVTTRHFSGPSPTCDERNMSAQNEWGLLKTTAITWAGWNAAAHKVPPPVYWGNPNIEIRRGDVIVTKAGPRHRVGVVAHVTDTPAHLMVSGKMIGLRPAIDLILPQILAGAISMRSSQKHLDERTTGMAESQVNFSNDVLLATPLAVPPMNEQRQIAQIMDTVDGEIQTTERLIAKLEQAKQGLLRALLTHGIDESGGIRNPGSDPDEFASTRLGPRSANWSVLRLEELIQGRPKNGYSPKEVDQWTGTLMLGLGCLTQSGFRPLQLKNAPLGDPRIQRAILNDGDLLISRANTRELVGLSGRFRALGNPCTYPDLMMRLTPNHRILPEYLEITLRAPETRRQIQAASAGTSGSMVKISSSIVCNLLVAIPEKVEQQKIVAVLNSETSRSDVEERRLTKLRALKRGLMDDLLTGRVRVGTSGE